MMFLQTIYSAIKTVLTSWKYKVTFAILVVVFVIAYISLPVLLIPGNTVAFQLGLYTINNFAVFLFISVITSLLVLLQFFSLHKSYKEKQNIGNTVTHGGVGIFSGVFGGLFASITCVPCAIGYIGISGSLGSVLLISQYQPYFIAAAGAVVLFSVYQVSRTVMGYCKSCNDVTKL